MKPPKAERPIWSEGMLVCPQHMQQQDLYHEQNLDARLRALIPAPWGVLSVSFDLPELQAGTLVMTALSGVLPDGTAVEIGSEGTRRPSARSISSIFAANQESLPVFLGIQLLQDSAANVSRGDDPVERRYRQTMRPVFDLITAQSRKIQVSEPNFVLLLGAERRDEYSAMQIAEIVRTDGGRFSLSESYIPPILAIGGAPLLGAAVRDLVSQANVRRRKLVSERSAQGTVQRGLRPADLDKGLFIQALDVGISLLRCCLLDSATSPTVLYQALLHLCSALAYPSGEGDPATFPGFSVLDLRSTFQPLIALARRQVDIQFSQHFIEFELHKTSTHWLVKDARLRLCRDIYFTVTATEERGAVQAAIVASAKAASLSRLRLILPTAAPGIPIDPLSAPPMGIPALGNEVFFRFDPESSLFQEALREAELAISIRRPYDPANTRLRVLGLLREGAEA